MAKRKRTMTPEQKAAAVERLAKARAVRAAANPPEYKNVHDSVLALSEEDTLCMKNVKGWIKSNRERLAAERKNVRMGAKGAEARAAAVSGYIRNMQTYLESGIWNDLFFGENAENPIQSAVIKTSHLAYNADGTVKRTVGTWYCDIGDVWTKEMESGKHFE
jgi:hypothetical protein